MNKESSRQIQFRWITKGRWPTGNKVSSKAFVKLSSSKGVFLHACTCRLGAKIRLFGLKPHFLQDNSRIHRQGYVMYFVSRSSNFDIIRWSYKRIMAYIYNYNCRFSLFGRLELATKDIHSMINFAVRFIFYRLPYGFIAETYSLWYIPWDKLTHLIDVLRRSPWKTLSEEASQINALLLWDDIFCLVHIITCSSANCMRALMRAVSWNGVKYRQQVNCPKALMTGNSLTLGGRC